MGNICSRSSNQPDSFSRPGRVLGSSTTAPGTAPRASVPATAKSHFESPGRTLGGAPGQAPLDDGGGTADARAKAALAAQKRAEATISASKGKLGTKLAAQKAQTHTQTLNEVSREERAAREADGTEAARRWN